MLAKTQDSCAKIVRLKTLTLDFYMHTSNDSVYGESIPKKVHVPSMHITDFCENVGKGNVSASNVTPSKESPIAADTPSNGDYIVVESTRNSLSIDENKIYCPVCEKEYPIDNFYTVRKTGYNTKYSDYLICKSCNRRRYQKLRKKRCENDEESEEERIGRVSLDPVFGLNVCKDELAIIFNGLAEGEKLRKIKSEVEKERFTRRGVREKICSKTIFTVAERLSPIMVRYMVDQCKPRLVDSEILVDTFSFTRFYKYLDENDVVRKAYWQLYLTVAVGGGSFGIYGFGVSTNKMESCNKCANMVSKYTSGKLRYCKVKFDGDPCIEKALMEAGVHTSNLISIPKEVCRSYVNKAEGLISILRDRGLRKRRYSEQVSIFARMASLFIKWNLFDTHTLHDGLQKTTVREQIQINAPPGWEELIEKSWLYILSNGKLFKIYYPVFKRGRRRGNLTQSSHLKL